MALFTLRKFFLVLLKFFQQEAISSANNFFTDQKMFSSVTKFKSCLRVHWEACKFLSGDKIFYSLTAILCQVILFREHDQ